MGIWLGSDLAGRWFLPDRRELKAADNCGLTAAAVPDGLIEGRCVMGF
jgi:hypothetical protein